MELVFPALLRRAFVVQAVLLTDPGTDRTRQVKAGMVLDSHTWHCRVLNHKPKIMSCISPLRLRLSVEASQKGRSLFIFREV